MEHARINSVTVTTAMRLKRSGSRYVIPITKPGRMRMPLTRNNSTSNNQPVVVYLFTELFGAKVFTLFGVSCAQGISAKVTIAIFARSAWLRPA
jgi:hypothetical protein